MGLLALIIALAGFSYSYSGTGFAALHRDSIPDRPTYKMFHFNLLWLNTRKQHTIDRISQLDPDLISISEASETWEPFLSQLSARWPNMAHCPEGHIRGGVKILSKWQLDPSNDYCGDFGSFQKTDVILKGGDRVTLGVVHPRWPWPASGPRQVDSFLPVLSRLGPDALIAGDFNATTWSWGVQRFADAGGLSIHPGIGGTWMFGILPAGLVRIIGLPIDNVMSKGSVRILSVQSLEEMGSDHLPLMIEFQIQ